ncbi:MAG TPA: hypothetical protein VGQ87_02485, partial [Patescibacteria group bacterium]|jgi:hypothetical protein|nr:hypothetical protein [Patescibacteria group bacterium]
LNDLVTFNSDTFFFGRPYFNSDTAGFALIKQGEQDVKISFEKDYLEQPVVTATISLDDNELDSNVVSILSNNLQYLITNKSTKGFTVRLNHVAPVDIKFSWIALAVKNPKIFSNENVGQVAGQTSDTGTSGQTETNESSPATEPTSQSSETQTESETPSPTDSTSDSQTTESPPQESIEAPAPQPPVVESSPETQAAE